MNNEAVVESINNPDFALVMPDTDMERGDWCGYITVENIDAVIAKIEAYLTGHRYSRLFVYNGEGDLRTSQRLAKKYYGQGKASCVYHDEPDEAWASIADGSSVWSLQTMARTGQRNTYALQPYIEFSQHQIRVAHFGRRTHIPEGESPARYIHQWWIALELDPNRS